MKTATTTPIHKKRISSLVIKKALKNSGITGTLLDLARFTQINELSDERFMELKNFMDDIHKAGEVIISLDELALMKRLFCYPELIGVVVTKGKKHLALYGEKVVHGMDRFEKFVLSSGQATVGKMTVKVTMFSKKDFWNYMLDIKFPDQEMISISIMFVSPSALDYFHSLSKEQKTMQNMHNKVKAS